VKLIIARERRLARSSAQQSLPLSTEERSSVNDFEAALFDYGVGQDFLRDVLDLFLRFVAAQAIEVQNEEFTLTDIAHSRVAESGECVLNSLPLRV
jgi:hypothetical protein